MSARMPPEMPPETPPGMPPVEVTPADGPLVLGLPHTGLFVPGAIAARLTARGRQLADTDWHVERLYDGRPAGATTVRATFHRYVIDANRAPADTSFYPGLYPGQNSTALVPLTDFDGAPIWETPPTNANIRARLRAFHAPYHRALRAALERAHARHGFAILLDGHSIRSRLPFLFQGRLPEFNIGTFDGASCAPEIAAAAQAICAAVPGSDWVLNGRFKGGWSTRHYGRPGAGFHAIQLELAQSIYLEAEAAPWVCDAAKTARLRGILAEILATLAAWAPTPGGTR